jgi:hypothetical protein
MMKRNKQLCNIQQRLVPPLASFERATMMQDGTVCHYSFVHQVCGSQDDADARSRTVLSSPEEDVGMQ